MIRQNIKELSQTVRAKSMLKDLIYRAINETSHKPTINPKKQFENNLFDVKYKLNNEVSRLKKDKEWRKDAKGWEDTANDYDKIIELLSDSEFVDEYAKRYYQKPKKEDDILYKTLYNRDDITFQEFKDFFTTTKRKTYNLGSYGNNIYEYTVKPRYPKLFDFMEATYNSQAQANYRIDNLYNDFQSGKNDKSYLDIEAIEKIVKRNFKDD